MDSEGVIIQPNQRKKETEILKIHLREFKELAFFREGLFTRWAKQRQIEALRSEGKVDKPSKYFFDFQLKDRVNLKHHQQQ
jgi:hypothetical protein